MVPRSRDRKRKKTGTSALLASSVSCSLLQFDARGLYIKNGFNPGMDSGTASNQLTDVACRHDTPQMLTSTQLATDAKPADLWLRFRARISYLALR